MKTKPYTDLISKQLDLITILIEELDQMSNALEENKIPYIPVNVVKGTRLIYEVQDDVTALLGEDFPTPWNTDIEVATPGDKL